MKYLTTLEDTVNTESNGILKYFEDLYNSTINYSKNKIEKQTQEWLDKQIDNLFGNQTSEKANPRSQYAAYMQSFISQSDWDKLTYEQQQAIRQKAKELNLPQPPFKDKNPPRYINSLIPSSIVAIAIYYMTKSPIGSIGSGIATYYLVNKYYNNK